jgi:colanic acid biosynthesis glycosyl transferase WcaI
VATPALGRPDAIVAVSPCFPALLPAVVASRARGVPLILWLQDLLPDGATATGVLESGLTVRAARGLERTAYSAAERIVVLSDNVRGNLVSKGVPPTRIVRAYNPATRKIPTGPPDRSAAVPGRVLTMGNIGLSQGLARLVRAFEGDADLESRGARFVITGDGVAAPSVRAAIRTDRVVATGLLSAADLDDELRRAQIAVVSQHYDAGEFNVPSKLMNFMAAGLPVVASVAPTSEAARIIRASGCGWVTDSDDLDAFTEALGAAIDAPDECGDRGLAGLAFARRNFRPSLLGKIFDDVIREACSTPPDSVAPASRAAPSSNGSGNGHRPTAGRDPLGGRLPG